MSSGPSLEGFHEIIRLVGRGALGGAPANKRDKDKGKVSRAERKTRGTVDTARLRREERCGYSIFGGVLLLLVGLFMAQMGVGGGVRVVRLDAADPAALQRALFGGPPHVIECVGARKGQVSSVLADTNARNLLPERVALATLDCDRALAESGQTVLERLGVRAKPGAPVVLVASPDSSGSLTPAKLVREHVRSPEALSRHLKAVTAPRLLPVNSTLELHRHCLRRASCLLVLAVGSAQLPPLRQALIEEVAARREVALVLINRRTHAVSFAEQIPDTNRPVLLALRYLPLPTVTYRNLPLTGPSSSPSAPRVFPTHGRMSSRTRACPTAGATSAPLSASCTAASSPSRSSPRPRQSRPSTVRSKSAATSTTRRLPPRSRCARSSSDVLRDASASSCRAIEA